MSPWKGANPVTAPEGEETWDCSPTRRADSSGSEGAKTWENIANLDKIGQFRTFIRRAV